MVRRRLGAVVAVLLLALLSSTLSQLTPDVQALGVSIRPVYDHGDVADPSVVAFGGRYVAVSTGVLAPRLVSRHPNGPWRRAGHALSQVPAWATDAVVWAADVVRAGDRWLLYFSAPVRGLGVGARCIGVAVARSPLGRFRPVGRRPLVCPLEALAPPAYDDASRTGTGLASSGAIDPSAYVAPDGTRFLLYRTQGFPASIRLLRLPHGGRGQRGHGASTELVRSTGAIENPVLVRRRAHWVLFTSEGYFGGCGYHTTWRVTRTLHDWSHSPAHLLVPAAAGPLGLTGLCGSGGADVAVLGGRAYLYFNSWRCRTTCPHNLVVKRDHRLRPRRALYAARLRWTSFQTPAVASFLSPGQ